jgi:hypothetical protein
VGVIAGEKVFGHNNKSHQRQATVNALNDDELDCLIITTKTAGQGYTMVGANNIIFLGSMYSKEYETQVLGNSDNWKALIMQVECVETGKRRKLGVGSLPIRISLWRMLP